MKLRIPNFHFLKLINIGSPSQTTFKNFNIVGKNFGTNRMDSGQKRFFLNVCINLTDAAFASFLNQIGQSTALALIHRTWS